MDELERLREIVNKVRQAANGAQIWHTVLDPREILEIVGREELKVINEVPKLVPMRPATATLWQRILRRR